MTRLNTVDRLTVGYLCFTLGVMVLRSSRIPQVGYLILVNACLLGMVWVLSGARGRGGAWGVAAEWYPIVFFVIFFEQIGPLVHAFVDGWFDPLLIAVDRALFGVDLTIWTEQFASYWLTELMQLAYISYFLITASVSAWLWFRRGRHAFRLLMIASAVTYYSCYLVFISFPIESPYHTMRHLQEVELRGGIFTAIIEWIERHGRVHGGAFPSAHVAGSVVTLLTAWRFAPWLGACLTPLVALLMVSTVYGRYHYGIDVLAGIPVAAIGYAVGVRLWQGERGV